ncbi:lipoprotein [Paucimonas lemoignei]|nr:lipoprotein [Paucimonas lemoignei]
MRTPLKAFISLLMALLVVSGCSRIGLAYRNLDIIIPWSLSDYLDMNTSQKDWFNTRLKDHLTWHCSTQLPGYLTWLDRMQQMVQTNQVKADGLQARTEEAKQAIAQISRQITPSAVELLVQLDDKQVQEMQAAFAKDQRKRENEFLKEPLNTQISERAERMEKRLTPWMGKLSPAQQQRIQEWSTSLGEQNRAWLDNRARWQTLFVATVQERQSPEFPGKIAKLLQDRETFWTPQYRAAYERTEQAAISLVVDLMAQSTPDQRQRLLTKIADTRKDFTDLSCLKAATAG